MASRTDRFVDPRRRLLVQALTAGLLAADPPVTLAAALLGDVPGKLAPGRSVYKLHGQVTVNGKAASRDTRIGTGDLIETGDASRLIFVVGDDAFLVRGNSNLQIEREDDQNVARTLRLVTGALLSVFGRRPHRITTAVASIGIRGTGVYVESQPDESYVCTCYGATELSALDDPSVSQTIVSTHHDAPRYILPSGAAGDRISDAPFKDHTDEELEMIEALVGRTPPFAASGDYDRPRRRSY